MSEAPLPTSATPAPQSPYNHERRSVSISKKLAWGAGTMSIAGFIGISSFLYERFYSREEGVAAENNVKRIEVALEAKTSRLESAIATGIANQTLALSAQFGEIRTMMREDSARHEKVDDKQNAEIENLKLIVMSKPHTKGR